VCQFIRPSLAFSRSRPLGSRFISHEYAESTADEDVGDRMHTTRLDATWRGLVKYGSRGSNVADMCAIFLSETYQKHHAHLVYISCTSQKLLMFYLRLSLSLDVLAYDLS
jgi:hypothetical protein